MTMFFEGNLTSGRRSWLGVRARRYERDSALRGVVPADNGA
jgi:hypothetical protein